MNLVELGEITDNEYDKEHLCAENGFPKNDRLVHCISSHAGTHDTWQMHNIHYATSEEVAMQEADYIDEITYHSMIAVNFCPFCGAELGAE